MSQLINIDDLELLDDLEVEFVKGLVTKLFGDFDPRVEIEGVYFGERRYPHTMYLSETNRFLVGICIPQHQADNSLARLAHLSHELVHCLNPNGPPSQATVLEEGLAEHAKVYLCQALYYDQIPNYDFCELSVGKYRAAFNKIEELIAHEGLEGVRLGIQKVRDQTGFPFCRITEDDLSSHFARTPPTLLEELSQPFRG